MTVSIFSGRPAVQRPPARRKSSLQGGNACESGTWTGAVSNVVKANCAITMLP